MEKVATPRLLIAGTGSGCGKTTVVCAILGALQNRGIPLRSFKCGPDYIDPMFHTKILGVSCRNLDAYLCDEETVKNLFARNSPSHCVSIIEGVMGYYDGVGGITTEASSHHLAEILKAPVVLVVNCKGQSLSAAAQVQGYVKFMDNRIQGVILNGVNEARYPMYKELLEKHTGVEVLGFLPDVPDARLESRHLGLVTAQEISDLRDKMRLLASHAERGIDLERLVKMARGAEEMEYDPIPVNRMPVSLNIGVAQDSAFCFYYRDNLDLLEMLGARLIPFSPIVDDELPEHLDGLIFGGGYPELYARQLSYNYTMLNSIRQTVNSGVPTLAECGGFMLLCDTLVTQDGNSYPMARVIDVTVRMTERLSPQFGYALLTAQQDNMLCEAGETMACHEFHYSEATDAGDTFHAQKPTGHRNWDCIHTNDALFAGYPHLHLWGNREAAKRFMKRCMAYRRSRNEAAGGAGPYKAD